MSNPLQLASSSLILGSTSPRRKELLQKAGILFTVAAPDIDETPLKKESPQKMVQRLSLEKAKEVVRLVNQEKDFFVLSADTTVVSDRGKNLGKPTDRADALKMLKSLQGRSHFVFTAYAILKIKDGKIVKKVSKLVKTTVTFRKMDVKELNAYLDLGESMDKAGAYGAQAAGMMLISKINGSYTSVIGLPLSEVLSDLKKIGFHQNAK